MRQAHKFIRKQNLCFLTVSPESRLFYTAVMGVRERRVPVRPQRKCFVFLGPCWPKPGGQSVQGVLATCHRESPTNALPKKVKKKNVGRR